MKSDFSAYLFVSSIKKKKKNKNKIKEKYVCVILFGCVDSSTEQYTDGTGVDLQQFIADTLNRNQKDRILLLKIEQELVGLAKDNK
jgi:hypothetical protein